MVSDDRIGRPYAGSEWQTEPPDWPATGTQPPWWLPELVQLLRGWLSSEERMALLTDDSWEGVDYQWTAEPLLDALYRAERLTETPSRDW